MKRSRRKCCFTGCENTEVNALSLNFFTFPIKEPDICQEWIRNCINRNLYKAGKSSLANKVVCEIHFEKQCFLNDLRNKLKKNAVPTLYGVEEEINALCSLVAAYDDNDHTTDKEGNDQLLETESSPTEKIKDEAETDDEENRDFNFSDNDDSDLPPKLDIDLPTKEEIKEEEKEEKEERQVEEDDNNVEKGDANDLLCCMCNKFLSKADDTFRENLGAHCDNCYMNLKTARRSEWMADLFENYKSCIICLNMVFNGLDVTLHDCTSEKLLCCNDCSVVYESKDDLVRHLSWCNDDKVCDTVDLESSCKKRFSDELSLENFLLKRHKRINNNHGGKRKKVKKRQKLLDETVSKNTRFVSGKRKGFICDVCDKLYVSFDEFVTHVSKHSNLCNSSSDSKSHQRNLRTCKYCHKSFKSRWYLKNHLLIHFCYKPYNCIYCDRLFRFSSNLIAHLRTHDNDRPYSCPHCDWSFKLSHHLKDHLETHKIGDHYSCNICFKKFTRRNNLNRHRRFHCDSLPGTPEKKLLGTLERELFSCDHCQKSFPFKSDLSRHIRTHTGEKPFKCKYCNTLFNQSGSLRRHVRRKHL